MVRRILITLVLVLIGSGAIIGWVWWNAEPKPIGAAYVGIGHIPLWNGSGAVRQRMEALPYGEKLVVLDKYRHSVEVRTPKGRVGWVRQDALMDPATWRQLGTLAAQVRNMTVQARGHTAVLSNVRIAPGLDSPRVGQLNQNTPVEILARGVAESSGPQSRKQDWLLVRARTRQTGQIAGWVLGDFIDDDIPGDLGGYVASTGIQPVAWFPLRKVDDPTAGPKPYYLLAATSGPEGQTCDFTMLRVYTWSITHHHYETAFVQNGLCGRLPIHVNFEPGPRQSVLFHFQDLKPGGSSTFTYRMQGTMVRKLRASGAPGRGRGRNRTQSYGR